MKWFGLALVCAIILFTVYETVVRNPEPNQPSMGMSANSPNSDVQVPKQYTVLLDVSASRPPRMIAEGRSYVESLVDRMNFSDELLIWQMYEEGVNDPESHLRVTLNKPDEITSLEEQESLTAARKLLKSKVGLFFDAAQQKPVMQTDILTTLSIASEQISPEKRNSLIFLSDMLQSDRRFEFEHLKRMPPTDWIDKQKEARLIRPLDGACIVVVGADPSTKEGAIVRDFWQRYFDASNARLKEVNYRTTPPADSSICQ